MPLPMTIAIRQFFKLGGISSLSYLVLLVFSLSILFDGWHAQRFDYTFYWTESVLFGFKWLLFIPGYAVLTGVRQIWSGSFKLNLILALALSSIHLLALGCFIMVINYLLGGHPFEHLLANLMADNGLYFLLIYLSLVFLTGSPSRDPQIAGKDLEPQYKTKLMVTRGGTTYFLEVAKISMARSTHGCCIIYLNDASQVWIDTTLIQLETQLDPDIFCRVHRQTIIRVSEVLESASRGNGDYDLTLENGIKCRLSRRYRETFRDMQV